MKQDIPLFKIYSDQSDINAISEVIQRGTYWTIGPEVEEFEKRIADFTGTKFALAFNSGTSALHSLLVAYDIKNKEVIVPSFTFISTANSVILAGGKPVFAEIEEDTFGLSFEDIKKRVNSNTKAVIIVHYGGSPARDTEKIKKFCEENKLLFLEDAAESMGADISGKLVGTFGSAAIFSFCQNKIIATGEGGAIITSDKDLYEKLKLIRSHGRLEIEGLDYFSNMGDNDYTIVGYNYRISSYAAALGISQLSKIKNLIGTRRKYAELYTKGLKNIKELTFYSNSRFNNVYQMYVLVFKDPEKRNQLQSFLKEKGIMSKVYFEPAHLKSLYTKEYGYKKGDLPITEIVSKKVLTIPLYPSLNEEEIKYIINRIITFFETGEKK